MRAKAADRRLLATAVWWGWPAGNHLPLVADHQATIQPLLHLYSGAGVAGTQPSSQGLQAMATKANGNITLDRCHTGQSSN